MVSFILCFQTQNFNFSGCVHYNLKFFLQHWNFLLGSGIGRRFPQGGSALFFPFRITPDHAPQMSRFLGDPGITAGAGIGRNCK
ncbi:hypothetical protein CRP01_23950 [Flavilitoribacter nigricans DSM 23189 = NBRC 102662]|uniref:Uncharacterized protein n=1 Tax=Flavilitoribacter nigricans (strain ATCC 23147 / DSM 23189 / NBRC 102662 / NCIMB 1420 / SS-2) TaxID=1122177 RepID=A0A2D0N649_FLAN2|nr:hypothetical protein CRP01_23950 [Flavilitoribacter nigricans DSM 23189 = NBRC 102662]